MGTIPPAGIRLPTTCTDYTARRRIGSSKGSIDAVADSLFAHGTPEAIIVLPDGDDGWYTTWAAPVSYRTCADTLHSESAVAVLRRADTLRRLHRARHRATRRSTHLPNAARRAKRAGSAGLSMGGYGAISIALRYPDVFGLAASHSGVVSPLYFGPHPFAEPIRYAQTAEELKTATESLWPRYQRATGAATSIAGAPPIRRASRSSQNAAARRYPRCSSTAERRTVSSIRTGPSTPSSRGSGFVHEYAEWPGAHTWRYWSTHVPESLAWMGQELAVNPPAS